MVLLLCPLVPRDDVMIFGNPREIAHLARLTKGRRRASIKEKGVGGSALGCLRRLGELRVVEAASAAQHLNISGNVPVYIYTTCGTGPQLENSLGRKINVII
jgi:hypothetical protein